MLAQENDHAQSGKNTPARPDIAYAVAGFDCGYARSDPGLTRMQFQRHITAQLLFLVLAVALPLSSVIAYLIHDASVQAEAQALERVREIAAEVAEDSGIILATAEQQLAYLTQRPAVRALDRSHCDPLIAGLQGLNPIYANVILVDLRAEVVCWSMQQDSAGTTYADREWFRRGITSSGFRTGTPVLGRASLEPVVPLTMPVRNDAGTTVGVLNLAASLSRFTRLVDRPQLPAGSVITVVSRDGLIIARSLEGDKWLGRDAHSFESIAAQLAQRKGALTTRGIDGVERIVAFTTMPGSGWLVSAGIPVDAVMAHYRQALRRILLAIVAAIIGVTGVAVVIGKAIRTPIRSLADAASAVSRGETGVRALESGPIEVATVGHEFNRMLAAQAEAVATLMRRTAQLEGANQELEAFSYSASHDLRQPLQTIDGFSRALLEDYGDKLDAEAKDYLQRLRAASQRIARLMDDLLKLSHLTSADMVTETADLGEIARSVADQLRAQDPAREVAFDIAASAAVHGDRRLLVVLMENLLGNAWTFTSKHPRARIEFGVTEREDERVYFVRDDGAGFDMAHVEKLFVPFQRLHTTSDFPGNGVGLATVRRIVLRHGGRVWAEAMPEKGATFYFTLPGAPAGTPGSA